MDMKKLKYMKKLAMKYAKYTIKSERFFEIHCEALEKEQDKKATKYQRKADKFKTKAYYLKEVYDLEVKILGAINNVDLQWEAL